MIFYKMQSQSSNKLMMVRPAAFGFNRQTAATNTFQQLGAASVQDLQQQALKEFEAMLSRLREVGIEVEVRDDSAVPQKPDAIFPNNWVSFHPGQRAVLYPMLAPNRRLEVQQQWLQGRQCLDLTMMAERGKFLEGTGSIVFDHLHRLAYAALSPRTNAEVLQQLCQHLDYQSITFSTLLIQGQPIYHTNVMMSLGTQFAAVVLAAIASPQEREYVQQKIADSKRHLIELSLAQMQAFAGNLLEVQNQHGKYFIVISQQGWQSLNDQQQQQLQKYGEVLPMPLNTIETYGGGSARCMLAEVF